MKTVGSSLIIKEDKKTNRQIDKQTKPVHKKGTKRQTHRQIDKHTKYIHKRRQIDKVCS
jgi:hypothetical protein